MTPAEMLEGVKSRFPMLIYDDEKGLYALLEQALSAYQDRAGVIRLIRISPADLTDNAIPQPKDFLALASTHDNRGQFVIGERSTDKDGKPVILFDLDGSETYPLRANYLAKLRGMNTVEEHLPDEAIGILENYLEVLISIRNIDFERRFAAAGKMDISNLPDENTLYERKKALEAEMTASRAIIPAICL